MNPIVRIADRDDLPAVTGFLADHWRRDHILVSDHRLLEWQHLSSMHPGRLNFVLAQHPDSLDILGILGFIPTSQYSLRTDWTEAFLAIWKVRQAPQLRGLGVLLIGYLNQQIRPALIGAIGLSPEVVPLYRALGYITGVMDHHVLFNQSRDWFSIASGVEARHFPRPVRLVSGTQCLLMRDDSSSPLLESLCGTSIPRKTWTYVCNRYLRHPVYRYKVLGLIQNGDPQAVLIARKVRANGSSVLRVVDYLGDASALSSFQPHLQNLLVSEDAEYIDIYQHGIPAEQLAAAGFVNRREQPSMVVPNYFQPFERANIELDFAYRRYDSSLVGDVRILRGDTDQDRPNLPSENEGGEIE